MTREEKLAILIYDSVWTEEDESVFVEKVKSAIKNFFENENPWHKVSEELPKEDGIYIVMLGRNSFVCALEFDAISKQWSILGYQNDVKYWMPIPELPKED